MEEPADQQPGDAEALSCARALLDRGDIVGAERLCRGASRPATSHPEQRKLMATLQFRAGRIDDALPMLLARHLEEWPDDFEAMLLLHRMQNVRGTREGREAAAELGGK